MATLIPREFVKDAAKANKVKWRTFDPWSLLLTPVIVQLSRQESLNGICDVARALAYEWNRAGLELPHRNTLSNANAKRDPKMAEDVFWKLLAHFKAIDPGFCSEQYSGYLSRIRNHGIFLLDSSTIQLTLNCFDWARHRRRKAAAKLHMTMELSSRLPSFAIVEDAAAELYRARWGIETFFKELKQTCQIHDFIGYSKNAVKWQVWAGLIAHLLLRYVKHLAKWKHSFSRLSGVVRGSLWLKKRLLSLLELYGTAGAVIIPCHRAKACISSLF